MCVCWGGADSSLLMSCAKDNRTLLWDLFSLKPVYELPPGVGSAVPVRGHPKAYFIPIPPPVKCVIYFLSCFLDIISSACFLSAISCSFPPILWGGENGLGKVNFLSSPFVHPCRYCCCSWEEKSVFDRSLTCDCDLMDIVCCFLTQK